MSVIELYPEFDRRQHLISLAKCHECDLSGCPQVLPEVVTEGVQAIVVGEAPGEEEVRRGRAFVGKSGQLLRSCLESFGLNGEKIHVTNACLCRPPNNRPPSVREVVCCSDRLRGEIELFPKEVPVLLCGATAASFAGVKSILSERGGFKHLDGRWFLPTFHPSYVLRNPESIRDFSSDVYRFSRGPASLRYPNLNERIPHHVITDPERAERAVTTYLRRGGRTVVDIETTELSPRYGEIMTLGFAQSAHRAVIITREAFDALDPKLIQEFWLSEAIQWEGHNAADYEWIWLYKKYGVKVKFLVDTMLYHYTLDERSGGEEDGWRSTSSHSLKALATSILDVPDYKKIIEPFLDKDGGYRHVPLKPLALYQALDCCTTFALLEELELMHDAPETGRKLMQDLLIPAANFLAEIEYDGTRVDIPYLKELEKQYEAKGQEGEKELSDMVGRPFNVRSPKQVAELLYDELRMPSVDRYTPRGTGADILEKLDREHPHPILQKIIEVRLIKTLRSTYIVGLMDKVDPKTGCVHTSFMLIGTATGRLSARSPNLQNIPKMIGPELRRAFIPRDGWSFIDADYSQLELRVWAMYSGCPELLNIFQNDYDLHEEVARALYPHVPYEERTYKQRDAAKLLNFGIPYGREAESIEEQMNRRYEYMAQGMTPEAAYRQAIADAREDIRKYRERFPVGHEWLDNQRKRVYSPEKGGTGEQFSETWTGRRRRFPLVVNFNAGECERQAINAPIQGLASDIALMAGIRLKGKYDLGDGAKMRILVHDSLVSEVRDDVIEPWCPIIKSTMEERVFDTPVPLKAELKIGKNWGDVK